MKKKKNYLFIATRCGSQTATAVAVQTLVCAQCSWCVKNKHTLKREIKCKTHFHIIIIVQFVCWAGIFITTKMDDRCKNHRAPEHVKIANNIQMNVIVMKLSESSWYLTRGRKNSINHFNVTFDLLLIWRAGWSGAIYMNKFEFIIT